MIVASVPYSSITEIAIESSLIELEQKHIEFIASSLTLNDIVMKESLEVPKVVHLVIQDQVAETIIDE